jgi:hypothetical protein
MFDRISFITVACAATALVASIAAPPAAAALKAEEILAASDAIRNPDMPFTSRIFLTEYRNKKRGQEGEITAYAKMNPDRGQFDTLTRIFEPTRDRGKMMLKNGNEIWFFDPATKSGMRISPQQRLLGQASNGDVVTVNLAKDYKAEIAAEEKISDGDRVERDCYKLKLIGLNSSVTYPAIDYWIERGTNRPIKALFYSDSGRLLKSAYYRRYEKQLGKERPTETVIIDGVDTQLLTVLRYTDYKARDIADTWLTKDGLTQVRD